MKRKIYCPNCGTKIVYQEPKGAVPIDEYPKCPKCETYIYLVTQYRDYIIKQAQITLIN